MTLQPHIAVDIVEFLSQEALLPFILCNKEFHRLGSEKLYRKLYLSDSVQATSRVYNTERRWSVLRVAPDLPSKIYDELKEQEAEPTEEMIQVGLHILATNVNRKLEILVNSIEKGYLKYVQEVWLDLDLDTDLQFRLALTLYQNGVRLQQVRNIEDKKYLNIPIAPKVLDNMTRLEIPPWDIHSTVTKNEYVGAIQSALKVGLAMENLKHLSLFCDPVTLCRNLGIGRETPWFSKLRLKSLTYSLRDSWTRNYADSPFERLSEIVDTETLESITVTGIFFDRPNLFGEELWQGFDNIKEATFIFVLIPERDMVNFLSHTKAKLQRFRFHYAIPQRENTELSLPMLRALQQSHSETIEYLDINLSDSEHEFIWYDSLFENRVFVNDEENGGCRCDQCKDAKTLVLDKILGGTCITLEEFRRKNVFHLIYRKGILPYTFGFDRDPSFQNKIGAIWVCDQLGITMDELQLAFTAMTHSMRGLLKRLKQIYPKLNRIVINDIPFIDETPVFEFGS